ncbi:RICIN domain-containing protein, partial [Streptomyces sp. HYC2]|uniref:RICIN domain-containing protein n=1 Tax=Streptomyces sp. HYC2 TaxID=2955207 RepID=UPI00248047FE
SSRALRTGLGLVSASLLATVLGVSLWPHGDGTAPAASTGASGTRDTVHGAGSGAPSGGSAAPGTALPSPSTEETRLRNIGAGLCLAVRGEPKAGAATALAECSSAWSQRWTLEDDGLLRSVADPGLCLDSHADAGVVVLGTCAEAGDERGPDVRYVVGARGELQPRWGEGLALASASPQADADIVVKVGDGTAAQRWAADSASVTPGPLSVAGPGTRRHRRAALGGRLRVGDSGAAVGRRAGHAVRPPGRTAGRHHVSGRGRRPRPGGGHGRPARVRPGPRRGRPRRPWPARRVPSGRV